MSHHTSSCEDIRIQMLLLLILIFLIHELGHILLDLLLSLRPARDELLGREAFLAADSTLKAHTSLVESTRECTVEMFASQLIEALLHVHRLSVIEEFPAHPHLFFECLRHALHFFIVIMFKKRTLL